MIDMLADETEGYNNQHLNELPGTNSTNRQRRLREILTAEVTGLTKEQRMALFDASERRKAIMNSGAVLS